jgi:phosphate transport system permease protein
MDNSLRMQKGKSWSKRIIAWAILSFFVVILSFAVFYIAGMLGFSLAVAIGIAIVVGLAVAVLGILGLVDSNLSARAAFLSASIIVITIVIGIICFIFFSGLAIFREVGFFRFLFGTTWHIHPTDPTLNIYGVFPMMMGTFIAGAGALVIGGGIGVLAAVFISRFCPKKIKPIITQAINMLAGIPSVIYGFFAIQFIVPMFNEISPNGSGTGPLAVAIILGIMIMPMVVALSRASIDAVEKSYYEGAVALGANDSTAVFKVVVPSAKSGIFASLILGLGRAVGETMAVIMVAGNSATMPLGIFESFRTLTTNIVFEMSYSMPGTSHYNALLGTGVVLLIVVLLINIIFNLVKHKVNIFAPIKRLLPKRKPQASTDVTASESLSPSTYVQGLKFEDMRSSSLSARISKAIPVVLKSLTYVAVVFAVVALVGITTFVLANGLPHINKQLLTGEFTFGGPRTIAPSIVTTFMVILLAGVIAFPLGIACAIFLNEYSKRGSKIAKYIELAVETLAGIPSILYGLFGGIFFVTFVGLGASITAGSLTVALMLLPVTVRSTQESLKSVPDTYREGAYALGVRKPRTIFKIILPSALPGIVAMIILGVGRIVAETAALIFTMGGSMGGMPEGYNSPGTTLAVAFYRLTEPGIYDNEAFATASILIMIVLALNILATVISARLRKRRT